MAKQTKKGNQGTTSQIGKNARKALKVTTDVHEIFEGVETMVEEPLDETTEIELTPVEAVETAADVSNNSDITELQGVEATTELQPEIVTVEVPETVTETKVSVEDTVTQVVVENAELQPEPVVETIIAPEAIEAVATDNTANDPETNVITTNGTTTDSDTSSNSTEHETEPPVTGKTPPLKKQAPKPPVAKEKKQSPKKATDETNEEIVKEKKVTLAESGYHWYRNWLRLWLHSHGVPSARFKKSATNYYGTITVLESQKEKGVLALELWVKENPDVKEMFWAVNK